MEVRYYTTGDNCQIENWINDLDNSIKGRVLSRLDRLNNGNFGDHKSVGDGVSELRMPFGAGYRVYYGMDGDTVVILLYGGDKSSQSKDIDLAKEYWRDYCA